MDNNQDLLTAALEYAAAGFRVFPLADGGKAPRTQHGFKEATTDPEQVRRWWTAYPNANIGLATGETASGIFLTVIDTDFKPEKGVNGFETLFEWQKEHGTLPATLTAKTGGGGYHLYFFTEKTYKSGANILGDSSGVDVRSSGGYVVAPPSVHKSGRRYEWQSGFDPAQIAQGGAVLDKLLSYQKAEAARKPKPVIKPIQTENQRTENNRKSSPVPLDITETIIQNLGLSFSEGSRNDSLFSLAASLQARGYQDGAIFDLVSKANAERCSVPLGDKELETIIRSATEHYPKGIPRTIEAAGGSIEAYTERLAEKFPYIVPHERKDGGIYYTVSPQLLAAYVRKHDHYFFLDTGGEKPPAFWYENGYYRRVDDSTFKGNIKRHIERFDEELVVSRDLDEVFKLLLTDGKRVRSDEMNNAESLICFKNGVLNIDTLELVPHSPDILFTIQIPCDWTHKRGEYVPECPRFKEFLETLTSGDKDMQLLLWEYIGFIISNIPGYIPKKALFLYGPGNTGKSQFLELIKRLIGSENYASTDIRELEERFATAALWNKRLAGSPDMSAMKVDELKMFKKLTGGDDIPFEFKGKDRFTDKFRGSLALCTNELPKFGGDKGDHVYERMMLCPCNNVIPPEKRDRLLIDKLYAEREGIVFYAVQALCLLKKNGYNFTEPAVCRSEIAKYKTENDNVLQFLDECTERREVLEQSGYTLRTTTSQMYKAYQNWGKNNGYFILSNAEFRKSLCRRYGADDPKQLERKIKGVRYYSFDLLENSRRELLCVDLYGGIR